MSVPGISTGSVLHIALATFGFSTVLAQSATAFAVVKYVGAAYLVYLGVRALRAGESQLAADAPEATPASLWRVYGAGILTNVFNPKVALFFLAFLPQFINPAAGEATAAFAWLGLAFLVPGTVWCVGLAVFAAYFSERLRGSARVRAWLSRVTGAVFVALGVRLALQRQ